MQFQNWSENLFIEYLVKRFPSKEGVVGIGDDCAVIPGQDGKSLLVTTDSLVEGIHFLEGQITAKALGYKTVAVNVSDITAMGGEPRYAFLSLALPKTTDCKWAKQFLDGVMEACKKWDILLLGGDSVGSKRNIFLTITLLGSAIQDKIKYRDCAQSKDIICVSGYLGDSGGGFKALQQQTRQTRMIKHLIHSHFYPEPSPKQGIWLAGHSEVHAMMDISDGLDCDLKRLIKSSRKGAELETTLIPISPSLSSVCIEENWDTLQLALSGGEDYCLLLTVAPESFENLRYTFEKMFGCPLFPIGSVTDSLSELVYYKNRKKIQVECANYNHFK